MVVHIVNWDIKEDVEDKDRIVVKSTIKKLLEDLVGVVPGLISAQVIIDPLESSNVDISLVSEIEDIEHLKVYQEHPAHKEAGKYVRQHVCNRRCLDYMK